MKKKTSKSKIILIIISTLILIIVSVVIVRNAFAKKRAGEFVEYENWRSASIE